MARGHYPGQGSGRRGGQSKRVFRCTVIYGKPGIASTAMLARRALANLSLHGHVEFGQAILLATAVDLFNQSIFETRTSLHVQWFARLVAHKSTPPSAGDNGIHHERPSALWSTARVQGQCWAPHGLRRGKEGF